ncbi:hypothetical protein [Pseudomonas sp. RIT-PI-r]|uniref:hypothetical protein n=1 Tax=Pseudomonas sp. RIT-PI-r TaxID=1699620 RepID=UPI0006D6FA94|nr:hypothetical protein [Pseudomonas sp. RIT-PI-r]KPG92269.1 hypothetical protein AK821_25690 [Pseudomonas sp. RIT-PI-r]
MHFERKWSRRLTEEPAFFYTVAAFITSVIVLEVLYIYTSADFWAMKFIDIINAIAQFATAGAFAFAVFQYTKSKKNERQTILVQECRDLISQMSAVANSFESSPEHGLEQTSFFTEKMHSLSGSFNAIFKELVEDTHKTIVRMRWQEMYFSDFSRAMEKWSLRSILADIGVDKGLYDMLELSYRYSVKKNSTTDFIATSNPFKKYNEAKSIISNEYVRVTLENKKTIGDHFQFFERNFFTNSELNDHLYGYCNIIDVKARAPVLAVINETLAITLRDAILEQAKVEKA